VGGGWGGGGGGGGVVGGGGGGGFGGVRENSYFLGWSSPPPFKGSGPEWVPVKEDYKKTGNSEKRAEFSNSTPSLIYPNIDYPKGDYLAVIRRGFF